MKSNVNTEERNTEGQDIALTDLEAEFIVGGRVFRITNVRVDATPLIGGLAP